MLDLVEVVTGSPSENNKNDDDLSDRLNNRYTVAICIAFAVLVSLDQYVGDPITCWVPQHFTGSHSSYANAYCWVRNTYYLPSSESIPGKDEPRDYLKYYQWIPFILVGQAFFFYLPSVLWKSLNVSAGIDADSILSTANSIQKENDASEHEDKLMLIRNQINRFLISRKSMKKTKFKDVLISRDVSSRRFGCYLVVLYLVTKLLYLVNVIMQFVALNSILSLDFSDYGVQLVKWMLTGQDWTLSPHVAFPRVTMCDFSVRRLARTHNYTVQCTLPINLYNEKIYMFLWFWMIFVSIMTVISLLTWLARCLSATDRLKYIQNHLKLSKSIPLNAADNFEQSRRFVQGYLRHDGVFLLRLIGHNTNTLTVSEIVHALFENWSDTREIKPTGEDEPAMPEKTPFK